MNPATLQRLINNCVNSAQEHSKHIDKLEQFCEDNWGFKFHDIGEMSDERIIGSVNYGEYVINAEEFRTIMDKAKEENNHD